ncbi:hypothetical protein F1643_20985 [Azospirillum sp. INR13]|uniref:hypothetical protein n=1 Tax=Azospirillum sp. INR13 TaxID=2596919 RepID=UPI0018926631|nr:hypothetical protein [Azospirillum sp. INR13]MBF5096475.1 hypothetical protein [Azospirillum sp. INR13]
MLLIGVVDAQDLLAAGGAGRSPSTTTAAAGLSAILLLLIGVVDIASRHPANTVFNAGVQHDVR